MAEPESFVTRGSEVLTPEEAGTCLEALEPGDSFCWYRGYLPVDRLFPRRKPVDMELEEFRWRYARERAVHRLAKFMLEQAAPEGFAYVAEEEALHVDGQGRGALIQRRIAPMFYEYVFVRKAGEVRA